MEVQAALAQVAATHCGNRRLARSRQKGREKEDGGAKHVGDLCWEVMRSDCGCVDDKHLILFMHGDLGAESAGDLNSSEDRSEEHTSELQSHLNLVCRLLLEKKKMER